MKKNKADILLLFLVLYFKYNGNCIQFFEAPKNEDFQTPFVLHFSNWLVMDFFCNFRQTHFSNWCYQILRTFLFIETCLHWVGKM